MSDILCLYYSRSGNTRQTMAEIAEALVHRRRGPAGAEGIFPLRAGCHAALHPSAGEIRDG